MKWNNKCQYTPASLREKSYEELYTLCLSAYTEGRTDERNKSLEAYRLRCSCLFGNKCMDSSLSVGVRKRICDGNCHYIKKYMSELDKLEEYNSLSPILSHLYLYRQLYPLDLIGQTSSGLYIRPGKDIPIFNIQMYI